MGCGSSKPFSRDPWTLAGEGSIAALAQWIDSGGSVDAIDTAKGRGTLLHAAARSDQVESIKLLLKCGANVNQTTPEQGSALHAAAAAGAGNAVTLLLANGAITTLRLNGMTAAELAQREGYPATAGLIRMTADRPPEHISAADSRVAEQSSTSHSSQQQRAAQRAAQQAKLREIHKQLTAVEPAHQRTLGDMARRASSDPTGSMGAALAAHSHQYQARQSRQPSAGPSTLGAGGSDWQQQTAQQQQQQGQTDAQLQHLLDQAQQPQLGSSHSSLRGGTSGASPLAPASPRTAAAAVAAGRPSAEGGAAGAISSSVAVAGPSSPRSNGLPGRQVSALPRIDSEESLGKEEELERVGSGGSKGSADSAGSSGANSLVNDPLLEFVRKAMLTKLPSGLSRSPSNLAATSPFATIVPGQQPEQQQQQQGGNQQAAAPPATVASVQPAAQPPTMPAGQLASQRTISGDGLGDRPSGSSVTQPSRGSSLSLSIDIRPWEIQFEDLALHKTIGEGSFGKVYVAKWHETLVAVKVLLDLEEAQKAAGPDAVWTLSNPILFNLQKECTLMASLRHPNVVQFMGFSALPPSMVTEYCAKGSLADVLKAANASPQKAAQLTWLRRLNMALDATKGMLYLHKRGIIHRDLKSPNLLVESTWKVKVADFNLSKIVEDTGSGRSTVANMNPRWLAPEILNGESATTASDVFSWGVVMWELLTFQLPWPHVSPWGLVGKLMDGMRLKIPAKEELPGPDTQRFAGLDDYVGLLQRCWAQDPAERPTFEDCIHELRKMLELQAKSSMEK